MNLHPIPLSLLLALMLGASHLLDGPSEPEMAQMVAEEVESVAQQQAREEFFEQVAEAR